MNNFNSNNNCICQTLYTNLATKLSAITNEHELEAKLIICHVMNWQTSSLIAKLAEPIPKAQKEQALSITQDRINNNKPLAYCLGSWEFCQKKYKVSEGVLIPRSDTEYLVEKASQIIRDYSLNAGIELGFGTGIISIELCARFPNFKLEAWDNNKKAYDIARANKSTLLPKTNLLTLRYGDFFGTWPPGASPSKDSASALGVSARASAPSTNSTTTLGSSTAADATIQPDIIISNPPYIETNVIDTLDPLVSHWEPHSALDGGSCGLLFYKNLIDLFFSCSAKHLVVEIGYNQKKAIENLVGEKIKSKSNKLNVSCETYKDLNNHPRVCWVKKKQK